MLDKREIVLDIDYQDTILRLEYCTPEQSLWISNLIYGIQSALAGDRDDLAWVFYKKDTEKDVGSFRFCCQVAEVDAKKVRKWVRMKYIKSDTMRLGSVGPSKIALM